MEEDVHAKTRGQREHANTADALLGLLFGPLPAIRQTKSVSQWWDFHRTLSVHSAPIQRAIAHGFLADRPAYAFASGFWEALAQLSPGSPETVGPTSFCATERGGVHPRAIVARLETGGDKRILTGHKTHCTLAPVAEHLLVIASVGIQSDGRNQLVAVRVPAKRAGVTLTPLKDLGFVPELPHAEIAFENVNVEPEHVLPGDGYTDYLKPFRTVEDIHVFGALLGWVFQISRRFEWPAEWQDQLAALLCALVPLGTSNPSHPGVHRTLGGIIERAHALLNDAERYWDAVDTTTHAMWMRDRRILQVAQGARAKRLDGARGATNKK